MYIIEFKYFFNPINNIKKYNATEVKKYVTAFAKSIKCLHYQYQITETKDNMKCLNLRIEIANKSSNQCNNC